MLKTVSSFIGGFVVGFIIIWIWNAYSGQSHNDVPAQNSSPDLQATQHVATSTAIHQDVPTDTADPAITLSEQRAGTLVLIDSVDISVDGWVVVHEERDGRISNALGAVRRDAGTYTDVAIPLLRPTQEGSSYWVVLYSDNGDREFGLDADFPLRDESENLITNSFTAQ